MRFFTIDVADKIGSAADPSDVREFTNRHPELLIEIALSPQGTTLKANRQTVEDVARKYLAAVWEAGRIYRYIAERKGIGEFIPEISMDETDVPQSPLELLIILAAIADEKIPFKPSPRNSPGVLTKVSTTVETSRNFLVNSLPTWR